MYKQLEYTNTDSVFLAYQKKNILHISVHLGGGVGGTVLGYISVDNENKHSVMCLGYTMEHIKDKIKSLNICYKDNVSNEEIIEAIPNFDVVILHIWNHPLIYDLLVRYEFPPCRLIIWGHNSGFIPPNVYPKKIFYYPDLFVFTTPLSYDLDEVKDVQKEKLDDIWSTAGVDDFLNIERVKHKGFIIGYIGTVDYAKLHPDFLEMCKAIDIPNVKFIVIGGLKEKEIEKQARDMGIDNIEFIGVVSYDRLKDYLGIFDVFGYPLAPYHYGTCDLTLQIAMASGVFPVVFANPMESYMIKNRETGIIVNNKEEYIKTIKSLFGTKYIRDCIGENCRNESIKKFSLEQLKSKWNKTLNKIIKLPKTTKKWDINKEEITYADVFIESLGDYAKPFIIEKRNRETINFVVNNMKREIKKVVETLENTGSREIKELYNDKAWQSETKGSVHNYSSYFPSDLNLKKWSELMR